MKKRFLLLAAMLLTLMGGVGKINPLNAQTEPETIKTIDGTVGEYEPSESNQVPIYNNYEYAITQQYYTAEEIGISEGTITSIAFKKANKGTFPFKRNLTIYMVETDEYHFGVAGKTMKAMNNSDIVFSGEVEFSTDDWTTIKFNNDSKSFEYHGKNILVCINDATGKYISDYNGEGSSYFSTFNCSYDYSGIAYRTLYKKNTKNKFDATSSIAGCAGTENTPFIRFTFSSIGTAYPEKPFLNTPSNNVTDQFFPEVNFTLGNNTTHYQILYKQRSAGEFTSVTDKEWIIKENENNEISYVLNELIYNNSAYYTYDWKVIARNQNDPSDATEAVTTSSDVYTFTTAKVQKPTNITSSYNEETKETTISWEHNTIKNENGDNWMTIEYKVYVNDNVYTTDKNSFVLNPSNFVVGNNKIQVSIVKGENESAKSDPINIEVIEYGSIEGKITDSESIALEGVTVILSGAHVDEPYEFITDENGEFSSSEILLGEYTITISKYGYESVNETIEITKDTPISKTYVLASAIAIFVDGKWNMEPANKDVIIKDNAPISGELTVKSIVIEEYASLTLKEDAILTVTGDFTNTKVENLIINDGAQIFQNNEDVQATFNMNIINPQDNVWSTEQKDGWQFISSPFTNASISNFTDNIEGNYDLYKYDGTKPREEWVNQKDNTNSFETEFVSGRAYLASYETETTATLSGTLNASKTLDLASGQLTYYWGSHADLYLIGNPFPFDMKWKDVEVNKVVNGCAVVTKQGGYDYTQTTIPAGDGFFIKAINQGPQFYYKYTPDSKSRNTEESKSLNIIAAGNAGNDNVVVNFAGEGEGFPKLQNFNDDIATVYVQNNGANYGIYNCDENTTEVELSFSASQMGTYSISFDINGDFENVVLVDRLTGIETNMLIEDEYTFVATSKDNAKRFFIRLEDNSQEPTTNSMFVYQSGEELIVNAEGSIEIIDMMGRVVYSSEVINNRINVSGLNKSAYIVRNINENTVRTQKIVIL